ncbi:uncharacterized protein SGFS_089310 [Streptomyces graminofaciens]|uniref:Uncharacterized protein n=2 Tax=Streptomyces graminofaciens TaxID=68212 RepID=A0ABN5W074_9ACTN|nr:uncharacterized protein SGFS_089310 [Streptomyces graminofaciens]
MALQPSTPRRGPNGEARVPAPAGESDGAAAGDDAPPSVPVQGGDGEGSEHVAADAESDAGEQARSRFAAAGGERPGAGRPQKAQEGSAAGDSRKRGRASGRRPSGRERHDEKITVYVSAEELMDLEHARLVLRGEHGLAVDRGRIVREAVAVVLADLESRGDASILVRRLRGR